MLLGQHTVNVCEMCWEWFENIWMAWESLAIMIGLTSRFVCLSLFAFCVCLLRLLLLPATCMGLWSWCGWFVWTLSDELATRWGSSSCRTASSGSVSDDELEVLSHRLHLVVLQYLRLILPRHWQLPVTTNYNCHKHQKALTENNSLYSFNSQSRQIDCFSCCCCCDCACCTLHLWSSIDLWQIRHVFLFQMFSS